MVDMSQVGSICDIPTFLTARVPVPIHLCRSGRGTGFGRRQPAVFKNLANSILPPITLNAVESAACWGIQRTSP